ncbi:hypothetical protein CVT26_010489 [Gymnopilus dilepis]|uniref:Uncharacterized protein n=1 Tax=Gymnopilus dilepis TaxID=231916 RepID=A0A409Y0H9_9AGAR|nr:hypothetical protein CVT26_010489 [Gymnopilus dilepis]
MSLPSPASPASNPSKAPFMTLCSLFRLWKLHIGELRAVLVLQIVKDFGNPSLSRLLAGLRAALSTPLLLM